MYDKSTILLNIEFMQRFFLKKYSVGLLSMLMCTLPYTSSTVNTSSHDGFDKRSNVFIFYSSEIKQHKTVLTTWSISLLCIQVVTNDAQPL